MIPQKTLVTINNLLWSEDLDFQPDYSDPRWSEIQLEASMSCYRGDCEKMEKVKNGQISGLTRPREFLHELEMELIDLEEVIHTASEDLLKQQGKKYNKQMRKNVSLELKRIREGKI